MVLIEIKELLSGTQADIDIGGGEEDNAVLNIIKIQIFSFL